MVIAFKALCLVAGLCLLAYVLFSYEDEEKRVKSWIDDAWRSLEETDAKTSQRLNAALVVMSQAASSVLARIYGQALISVRAFLVPVTLGMGGIAILMSLVMIFFMVSGETIFGPRRPPDYVAAVLWGIPMLVGCLAIAGSFMSGRKSQAALAVGGMAWVSLCGLAATGEGWSFIGVTAVGFSFDALSIALVRRMLRRVEQSTAVGRTILLLGLAGVTVPLLMAVIGFGLSMAGQNMDDTVSFVEMLALCAIVAVLSTTLLFLVLLVCIVLRVIVGVAPRLVYVVSKFKLLENRKSAIAVGIALVGVWTPQVIAPLEKWAKVIGGA
jgi:hypothetical protein